MGLELYLDLISQPCRAVYLFAKANGLPFEVRSVELLKGQQMTEDFAKVNSLKRVPALKDGDFALAECVAILHYLSQKYKTPAHWYPPELQARARVDEYLSWHSDSVRGTFGTMLWIRVLGPLIDVQIPKEKVDKNMAAVVQSLQHLEQKFLQDKPFLTGDKISLADLMALEELVQSLLAKRPLPPNPGDYKLFSASRRRCPHAQRTGTGNPLDHRKCSLTISIENTYVYLKMTFPKFHFYTTQLSPEGHS